MTAILVFVVTTIAALLGVGYTYRSDRRRKRQQKERLEEQGREYQELLKKWQKK